VPVSAADDDDSVEARVARAKAGDAEWLRRQEAEDERRAEEEADRELIDDLLDQRGVSAAELVRWTVGLPDESVSFLVSEVAKARPKVTSYARLGGAAREALDVAMEVRRQRIQQQARRLVNEELHPSHEPPAFANLTDLLAEPDEDVQYLVDGVWPVDGKVVLAAQNKSGKTTLVNNLIRSLVDGDPFLDRFAVERVQRVVLIDNEMSPGQIRRWLRDQGIRKTDSVEVLSLRGRSSSFNILDPTIRAGWAERIGPADVLLFDCLRPALDALGLSEDKDSGRFLEAMDALCAEAGIRQLGIVHHMGHSNERSRGDSRIEDWPDAKWKLLKEEADDPDSPRYLSAFGRDVDQPERRLAYDPDTRHLSVDGGSRRAATASRIEDLVLLFIGGNPGCGMNDIRDNVPGDDGEKRRIVKSLTARGDVRMVKVGQKHTHYLSVDVPQNVENS
jgi:hypothetical protein